MPSPISIISTYYWSEGKFSQLVIGGEIRNNSNLAFRGIVLKAKVYYLGQITFDDLRFQPTISATLPGQLNTYRFNAGGAMSTDFTNYSATIEILTTTVETSDRYRNLQVESITTSRSDEVSGFPRNAGTITIRNNYPQPVHDVRISTWSLSRRMDTNVYICSFSNCSGSSFVSRLSPNQVFTTTVYWTGIAEVVPSNLVRVVAQGVVSP
ncbi:MAG: hypothetical protein HC853_07580 [Anaerolineae bacterium]|nr:hypothetical protein [Anaerolineae bacterium]